MRIYVKLKWLLFLSLFSGWSLCHAGEWIRTGPTTISFHGSIEIDELRRFQDIYKPTDETIILQSGGGRMDAALDIGKVLIQNKKLTAVVQGICASSCANYLFLAAQIKIIDHGIVGFHGNWKAMVSRDDFNKHLALVEPVQRAQLLAFHNGRVQDESDFLSKVGVSQALFDRTQKENDEGLYEVYLPGPIEFEKYGIHHVIGAQDLSYAKGFKVLFENGPGINNAEDLKDKFRNEYVNASDKRKKEIEVVLKSLNEQFPPRMYSKSNVNAVGKR
ncbi:MAG: hypothetical protein ACXWRG_05890 [Bdellovibrio sp.]